MRGTHVKRDGVQGGAREARGGARFLQLARWCPARVVQGVLYAKRTARGRSRGSFWQQNAFRSSFLESIGTRDYSETRSAASLTLGDDGQGPRAVPPGPVFGTSAGGIAVSRLPAHRLVLVVTLELGFPIDRLGCLVISSCSPCQSVAVSRTKALHCPLSSSGKPSLSSYTRGGRGAVHRGNVTCLYLRAAPSEIDA